MMRLERCEPCDIPTPAEQAAEARAHGACEECGQSPCECFAPLVAWLLTLTECDIWDEEPCAPDDPALVAIMAEVQR